MVQQCEFFGVWVEVCLSKKVRDVKGLGVMSNEREWDNQRDESLFVVVDDTQ